MKLNNGAPIEVPVQKAPLSTQQQQWLDAAVAEIDEERMRQFNLAITDIHSPTGYEREVNKYVVAHLNDCGFKATYQRVDDMSGNAIGRLPGSGEGPTLMLYAPMDTHLEADLESLRVSPKLTCYHLINDLIWILWSGPRVQPFQ